MKTKLTHLAPALALGAVLTVSAFAQEKAQAIPPQVTTPDSVETRLGTLRFRDGMPDEETTAKLYAELDYIHAADSFLNGVAAVDMWALRKGFLDAGVNDGDVLIFSELMDAPRRSWRKCGRPDLVSSALRCCRNWPSTCAEEPRSPSMPRPRVTSSPTT